MTYKIVPFRMGNSNAYLVIGNNLKLLVDTGIQGHLHNMEYTLSSNRFEFLELDYIIVTHSHYDHAGNLAEIKKRSGAKIFAHIDELKFLN